VAMKSPNAQGGGEMRGKLKQMSRDAKWEESLSIWKAQLHRYNNSNGMVTSSNF
jgi:hypothetical protein